MNYATNLTIKYLFSFIIPLLTTYIVLFVMCLYAHVRESNIIVNRADALLIEISREGKLAVDKVALIQNMARKSKPSFFHPNSVFNSLFGKRVPYRIINKLLGDTIKNYKAQLAGINLGQVDLEGVDLSKADLHGAQLGKANLSGAKLREANLITTNFEWVNFQGASFFNAKVYKAKFREANLRGADLGYAEGLSCAQIKSAVIDESTILPDYISLTKSSDSSFKCIKNRMGGAGKDLGSIDLTKSHLPMSEFKESNLSHSDFRGALLFTSRFEGANLSQANFQGVDVSSSSFEGANFSQANFQGADVNNSSFQGANLSQANFQGAIMIGSRFHDASFTGADLRGADLRKAKGLTFEQIKTAVIDENTFLPDLFALKCDVKYN
ncbi:pentapeptide repeat-containing protein [Nitrospinae bacterium]|nr:pentapeptide repeat-containing protein [Nitrospinota bacterium]